MSNKIYELSDDKFIELIKTSHNIGEVLFKLKLSVKGNTWGYSQVKQRMKELNLTAESLLGKEAVSKAVKRTMVVEKDLLKKDCKHSRHVLRKYLISNNLIPYKCAICNLETWMNNPISLELDHINGINNDNRLENLRFLCPNCHSQTSTYGSRNSTNKRNIPIKITSDQEKDIINLYKQYKNADLVKKYSSYTGKAIKQVLIDNGLYKGLNQKFVIQYDINNNELRRFGTITEAVRYLMDNKKFRTNNLKTARNTFLRNCKKFWLDSYWKIVTVYEV